jgi:hypothetical protein
MQRVISKAAVIGLALGALGTGVASAAPSNASAVRLFSGGDASAQRASDVERGLVFELEVGISSYAGFVLNRVGGEVLDDVVAPTFDVKASEAADGSGGSPRLVVRLSDGGEIHVRPLDWSDTWTSVDGAQDGMVDNFTGGSCDYLPMIDWATAVNCHGADVTVTSAHVMDDSWWKNGEHTLWIDAVQFDGTTYSGSANA